MRNPKPTKLARRTEMRRKELGYPDRCFYCRETDVACFEEDHPVTEKLDSKFKRVVCRNCHRKLERNRDVVGLTTNGRHKPNQSEHQKLLTYLLLLAEDLDSIADLVEFNDVYAKLLVSALRSIAASLRRKAKSLPELPYLPTNETSSEWYGQGCA